MHNLMLLFGLVLTSSVNSEVQSMQYQMHVSRKSRSNSAPYETGYVFSQLDNDPGTLETFGNGGSGYNSIPMVPDVGKHSDTMTMKYGDAFSIKYSDKTKYDNDSPMGKYSDAHKEKYSERTTKLNSSPIGQYSVMSKENYSNRMPKYNSATTIDWPLSQEIKLTTPISSKVPRSTNPITYTTFTEPPMTEHAMDYAIAKSKAEYDSKYLPSKIISDALYERLKSVMHYEPSSETMSEYGHTTSDFHMDDNDIRTSSRIPYENWPYSYPMPYEYENMKIDTEIQKAKDKRFAIDTARKIIPVHEHHEYDLPTSHSLFTHTTPEPTTPDNPNTGNQPFFSFVLNDYFQKNDDDPLTFKGMDWGNEFDYHNRVTSNDVDSEAGKRNRRLQTNYHHYPSDTNAGTIDQFNNNHNTLETAKGESATEKGYQKKHEFDKHEKGDDQKSNHNSGYEHKGNNYIGFKDFTDSFTNKFGGEDYKKDSKYLLKKDQDKSEKRKGFRRVYHKDEYQEDNEFYDNTNKLAKAEEKGSASIHNGGSHAFIKSNAAAAVGNEANAYNKAGDTQNSNFEKNHSGNGMQKGLATDFNRYRDVAKKAAQSNNADYIDSYRI